MKMGVLGLMQINVRKKGQLFDSTRTLRVQWTKGPNILRNTTTWAARIVINGVKFLF